MYQSSLVFERIYIDDHVLFTGREKVYTLILKLRKNPEAGQTDERFQEKYELLHDDIYRLAGEGFPCGRDFDSSGSFDMKSIPCRGVTNTFTWCT
jgi:hypothetical protein